jgi:hypothetical protein
MELIKATEIKLARRGDHILAVVGFDLKGEILALGASVPDALRSLAAEIESRAVTIWVPAAATPYWEDGVLKAACPECGAIHEMSDFERVIALVCDHCGAGVSVDPEA